MAVAGRIEVDSGAESALRAGGSLLAVGIRRVEGSFERGDTVDIAGANGLIARGLVGYSSAEIGRIQGRRREELEAILGYAPRSAVIHRDQMVML
jgi:glutamate 5-kinase